VDIKKFYFQNIWENIINGTKKRITFIINLNEKG